MKEILEQLSRIEEKVDHLLSSKLKRYRGFQLIQGKDGYWRATNRQTSVYIGKDREKFIEKVDKKLGIITEIGEETCIEKIEEVIDSLIFEEEKMNRTGKSYSQPILICGVRYEPKTSKDIRNIVRILNDISVEKRVEYKQ